MSKVRIEVHTPFNLNLPETVGGEKPFQKFDKGVHVVSKEVAAHSWVKQHSKPFGAAAKQEEPEIEETEEEVEETEEGEAEETEEEASEESAEEQPEEEVQPQRRGRGRR